MQNVEVLVDINKGVSGGTLNGISFHNPNRRYEEKGEEILWNIYIFYYRLQTNLF